MGPLQGGRLRQLFPFDPCPKDFHPPQGGGEWTASGLDHGARIHRRGEKQCRLDRGRDRPDHRPPRAGWAAQATLRFAGQDRQLRLQKPFSPFFIVQDSAANAMGVLDGTNRVVFARKDKGTHTSWFCSLPPNDDNLLGHIFKEAGAHVYLPPGDVIHAGGGIVCLHTAQGGERELVLRNGRRLRLQLQPRSTSLYDAGNGETLLV